MLINPVNLSTDGFKQDVKLVLQAVADKTATLTSRQGSSMMKPSLTKFSQEMNPPLGESPYETTAFEDLKGQHLVAMYSGGLTTGLYPYEVDWYPGAFTGTPNVGQYVDFEEWKP